MPMVKGNVISFFEVDVKIGAYECFFMRLLFLITSLLFLNFKKSLEIQTNQCKAYNLVEEI
jgi:hypothetical protein